MNTPFAAYLPPADDPDVLYADEYLLVANKPAGLLAVPGRGADKQDCLAARILKTFADAQVVHRLDMATSGLIVFARGIEMKRRLSAMFREREVEKRYIAVVSGKLENSGDINLPIAADWPNRPRHKIDLASGKPSLTRYRVLAYDQVSDSSRAELEPMTGRTHQLRLHLAAIGHAILGDALYDGRPAHRMLLHAASLVFIHPRTGEPLNFSSAPPF